MRIKPRTIGLALLFASLPLLRAADEDANLKYFRDIAETRTFTLGRPVSPKITPDGKFAIFLRSRPRDPTLLLWELDIASGRER